MVETWDLREFGPSIQILGDFSKSALKIIFSNNLQWWADIDAQMLKVINHWYHEGKVPHSITPASAR